jgi:hypothetical protein
VAGSVGFDLPLDLFAGLPGDGLPTFTWYEHFLASEPSFVPTQRKAVWELADHWFVFIEERPQHAGHAMHTIFVDDLDALVDELAARGIEPAKRETDTNGVRKTTIEIPMATRSASAAARSPGVLVSRRGGTLAGVGLRALDELDPVAVLEP